MTRVLHVNKFLYRRGGAEGYMLDVAALQAAAGDDVAFFGTDHEVEAGLPLAGTLPSYVEMNPPPRGLAPRAGAVAGVLWNRDAEHKMALAVDAFRPDVVHLHNIYHHLSPSILRPLRTRGARVVMTLHDYKLACPTYQFLDKGAPCEACLGGHFSRAVVRRCRDGSLTTTTLMAVESALHAHLRSYASVDAFICPSRFMVDKMTQAGVFPERLRHIPHPVACAPARRQRRDGVLFAGRLSQEKGCDVLIEALGRLRSEGHACHLTVAGDGPDRAVLEELAARVTPGAVTFLGRVDKPTLGRLLAKTVVAVVPSRWHENQPLAVLEGLAAGAPVIATTLGGMPELVRDGLDGLLVPPDNPAALAAGLGRLLSDPARAARMGAAGRARVAQEFTAEVHLAALRSLYQEERPAA